MDYLKRNKAFLVKKWAAKVKEDNHLYDTLLNSNLRNLASKVFDGICYAIENNDSEVNKYIQHLIRPHKFQGFSLTDTQKLFNEFRYILLPIILKKCNGSRLSEAIIRANRAIDSIIFHLGDCFQESYEHQKDTKSHVSGPEIEVQKRTRELEESRKNYHILLEEMSDGCFVNQEGRIVFANKTFCEMHGYKLEELIGKPCVELIAEEYREMVIERSRKQIRGEIPAERYVYYRRDKYGRCFPTENKVKRIEYNGKPAILGLCSDITERVQMEERLRQKDRLALIGKLTTSIAHEIKNPLSAIKVNIQLLLDNLKLQGNDLRRLQIANEQVCHLENIMSQILNFAKPIKLNYTITNVIELIDHAVEIIEEKLKEKDISLVKKISTNLPVIMVDKEKMIEVIVNVLTNAIEAIDKNSDYKRIEFEAKAEMFESRRCVRLSIADSGIGIDLEDKDKIFDPFFTKGKKGGVGLGLSLVKKIIDAHHGQIQVRSEKGHGTCFDLIIPTQISQ